MYIQHISDIKKHFIYIHGIFLREPRSFGGGINSEGVESHVRLGHNIIHRYRYIRDHIKPISW